MYLTDSAISPLKKIFVESEDPICSDVNFSIMETLTNSFSVRFTGVKSEKIEDVPKIFFETILNSCDQIDINRIHSLIDREILRHQSDMENNPHMKVAFNLITIYLYGKRNSNSQEAALFKEKIGNILKRLNDLLEKDEHFWSSLVKSTLIEKSNPPIIILTYPSKELASNISAMESNRINEQKIKLGNDGLKKCEKKLENANLMNNKICPPSVIESIPIPDFSKINFIPVVGLRCELSGSIQTYKTKYGSQAVLDSFKKHLNVKGFSMINYFPFSSQFDQINSEFVELSIVMNTRFLLIYITYLYNN